VTRRLQRCSASPIMQQQCTLPKPPKPHQMWTSSRCTANQAHGCTQEPMKNVTWNSLQEEVGQCRLAVTPTGCLRRLHADSSSSGPDEGTEDWFGPDCETVAAERSAVGDDN
jgi:hypothetical protein